MSNKTKHRPLPLTEVIVLDAIDRIAERSPGDVDVQVLVKFLKGNVPLIADIHEGEFKGTLAK